MSQDQKPTVWTIECCPSCDTPKVRSYSSSWMMCPNDECVAFNEPQASASYRPFVEASAYDEVVKERDNWKRNADAAEKEAKDNLEQLQWSLRKEEQLKGQLFEQVDMRKAIEKERDELIKDKNHAREVIGKAHSDVHQLREELESVKAELKATKWVMHDNALRTYDGLTEELRRHKEALERLKEFCNESAGGDLSVWASEFAELAAILEQK